MTPTFRSRLRAALRQALLAAAACLAMPLPGGAAPLAVAVAMNPMSLPLYVAERERYFEAEGLQVRLVDCVSGALCLQRMLDGRADAATAADAPIMFHSFRRTDFHVVGTFATTPDDAKLVARRSRGIERPAQLVGRRIGVATGTSGQYFLAAFLLLHAIDPAQVEVVHVAPEQMTEALRAGRVDALSVWEPHAWRTVQALGVDAVVLPSSSIYNVTFNLVVPRRPGTLDDDEVAALLRALERAQQLIRRQPQLAQRILRERLQGDQRFVDWVWPRLDFRLGLDQSLIGTLESQARWALRERLVDGERIPNYLRFVHAAPLKAAVPDAVGMAHR